MKLHDTPPFAPVLMESTRAMGYSLESAIADIIDNSIAAQASSVLVKFSPYDTMQYGTDRFIELYKDSKATQFCS